MKETDNEEWGNWQISRTIRSSVCSYIEHKDCVGYYICTGDIKNSKDVVDWLFHMMDKTWISTEDLGNLVKVFRETLGYGIVKK